MQIHCDETGLLLRYSSGMRLKIFGIVLLGIWLLASSAAWAQQTLTRTVTIQVTDQAGGSIPQARIRFFPSPDTAHGRLRTDEHGNLSLNLRAGSYTLCVSAQGFKTWYQPINVDLPINGASDTQLYPVVLQLGPMVSPVVVEPGRVSLRISADAYHGPVELTAADFRALPHIMVKVHNGHTNSDETYSGVLLTTLMALVDAPIGTEFRGEELSSSLVASGSEGYSVVLSVAEIDPSIHRGQVIVADARNGHSLGKSGPYQLIVSEDRQPTRWVRNLHSIWLEDR